MMNSLVDRFDVASDVLEAKCDDLHILTGRLASNHAAEQQHDDHKIVAPGKHASGVLRYCTDSGCRQQTKVSDRHISVIPAGHPHAVEWKAEAFLTTITIKATFLSALARANGTRGYRLAGEFASVDPFLWHMVRGIERHLAMWDLEKSYIESVAIIIGQHLLSTYGETPSTSSRPGGLPRYKMRRAVDYIEAHYKEEFSFRDIAGQLDMSPFHFARMFKHSTGESPHQFIMRCRVEAAKKLLVESDMPIADISFAVGYKNQSYFTTRFAILVGMTPAVFRGRR
jgi:AraC family transcriptional regulator